MTLQSLPFSHFFIRYDRKEMLTNMTPISPPVSGEAGVWLWYSQKLGRCVVKISHPADEKALRKIQREFEILTFMGKSEFLPPLLYKIEKSNKLIGFVTKYIRANKSIALRSSQVVAAFAEVLYSLHKRTYLVPYPFYGLNIPALLDGHAFWIDGAEKIIAISNELGELWSEVAAEGHRSVSILKNAKQALTAHIEPKKMALLHGDIAHENIIFSRRRGKLRVYLLDFGCSFVGPIQYDLARFSVSFQLGVDLENELLTHYSRLFEQSHPGEWNLKNLYSCYPAMKALAIFDLEVLGPIAYLHSNRIEPSKYRKKFEQIPKIVDQIESIIKSLT